MKIKWHKLSFHNFTNIFEILTSIICVDSDMSCIIVKVTIYDLYMKFAFEEKNRRYIPLVTMLLTNKGYNTKLITICLGSLQNN